MLYFALRSDDRTPWGGRGWGGGEAGRVGKNKNKSTPYSVMNEIQDR